MVAVAAVVADAGGFVSDAAVPVSCSTGATVSAGRIDAITRYVGALGSSNVSSPDTQLDVISIAIGTTASTQDLGSHLAEH